jgi:hypothetical protein
MSDTMKDHIRRLMLKTFTAQKTLEAIEMEYPVWLWQWSSAESGSMEANLQKLESEVTLMEVDCIEMMGRLYHGNENGKVLEQCFATYMSLDRLIVDLKDIRINMNYPFVYFNNVERLQNDWMRFFEVFSEIPGELRNNELEKC